MAGDLNNLNINNTKEDVTISGTDLKEFCIKLSEEDIPGASLDGKDPKQLTVKQLKFWLLCRGARVSGKKDELVSRVNNYNAIPDLRNRIVDPDPDNCFTKCKLEQIFGTTSIDGATVTACKISDFPANDIDFSDDLTVLPCFNPGDLYNLVKNSGKSLHKYRHVPVVDKPVDKGFFLKNLVHDLQTCRRENTVYVRALCWASMAKSVEYQVKLMVDPKGNEPKVKFAMCDPKCPASLSGCCCHVMATIWILDEYSRLKLTRTPPAKSKTSKPQAWGIPNQKRKVIHEPVMETEVVRPKYPSNIINDNRQGIKSTFFDPRPLEKRCLDATGLKEMSQKLQKCKPNIPYAKVLQSNDVNIEVANTIVGMVAKGSVLEMHLKHLEIQPHSTLHTNHANSPSGSTASIFPNLPLECVKKDQLDENTLNLPVQVTLHDCHKIFQNTMGQAKNTYWKKERQLRLTASNFGKVINRKSEYTDSFIQSICNPTDISTNPFVKYGTENEDAVAQLYKESMHCEGKHVELYDVGLCVNPSLPHLGATLDRGVCDPSSESRFGGLEVKTCPKAGKMGLSILETADHPEFKRNFFLQKNGEVLSLNHSHNYYYQVQGQLALTKLPWVDFVAHSGIGCIYKERVHFDSKLWDTVMLPKLNMFYFSNQRSFTQGPCARHTEE